MNSNIRTIILLIELLGLADTDRVHSTTHTYEFTVCPGGFQSFESSCYRLVSDSPTDGYTARTECQQLASDSHLAFIQSQSEMTFLQGLAISQGVDEDYWFGLTYTNDTDHPHWLDGSLLGNFTAWDRYGAFNNARQCVRLRRDDNYLWNDRYCSTQFGYICEVEIASTQYTFVTEHLSWSEARDACASADGHLAIINSEQESLGLQAATSSLSIPSSRYWVGLVTAIGGTVAWLDGTVLTFSPDNFEVDDDYECYTMNLGSGDWRGWDCTKTTNYICEASSSTLLTVTVQNMETLQTSVTMTDTPWGTFDPTTEPEGVADPITTPVGSVDPTTTPEYVTTDSTTTREDNINPTTTVEGLVDQTNTPRIMVDPKNTTVGAVDPTTKPEDFVDPTTKPKGVVDPTTKSEGVVDITTTPEGVADPTITPVGSAYPTTTPGDVATDSTTTREDNINPTSTTTLEGMVNPTNTPEILVDPTNTPAGAVDTTNSPEAVVDTTTTPDDVLNYYPVTTPFGDFDPDIIDSDDTPEDQTVFAGTGLSESLTTNHYRSLAPLTTEGDYKLTATTPVDECASSSLTCRYRSQTYYLHANAKTLPDHLTLQTVKGIRSDLRCAGACLAQDRCRCFVVFSNNDCLLSAAGTDEIGLLSHDSAKIYCMGNN
ncbi:mucin-17-like [Patiria miniata]|uniref:C-type lectin domain-containing protein n=1 Tax=Patiria miniata TaxID=46514 RepID=A0A914BC72_PATMI|nr:mucin-17-like [Patiria miniata]